jgi:hypothetical protein
MWLWILVFLLLAAGAGAYFYLNMNKKPKIIAFYESDPEELEIRLVLPSIITKNLTVTSTPALPQNAVVDLQIGTPDITITGFNQNTLYTFSIPDYESSNPIFTGLRPPTTPAPTPGVTPTPAPTPTPGATPRPTPTPAPTPMPPPLFTVTTGDTSVTISYKYVPNATSYQFLLLPFYINESSVSPIPPNPFTFNVSSQTSDSVTFSNVTPYRYRCYAQATTSSWSTELKIKEISMPLIINNPIIAVTTLLYDKVHLYFKKDESRDYSGTVTSTPEGVLFDNATLDNAITLNSSTLTPQPYRFFIQGIAGGSNLLFRGAGTLSNLTLLDLKIDIAKLTDTTFTASIKAITGTNATGLTYQFIVYDTNLNYLYSAVSQTSNTITYSKVPYGSYTVTVQVSNSTGTRIGVSDLITI